MNYIEFKSICSSKFLGIQYEKQIVGTSTGYSYYLFAYDGPIKYECDVFSNEDIIDFETNYKSISNKLIESKDSSGNLKVRPREVEGTLAIVYCYFTTRDINSLDCANNSHYSIITSENSTETIIDFKPNYSYWVTGGYLKVLNTIEETSNVKIHFIFAPEFSPSYGGNWYFINNKKLDNDNKLLDISVPSKEVKYYSSYPTANAMRLLVQHETTDDIKFEFYIKKYI